MSALKTSVQMAIANSALINGHQEAEAWLFRDDIGAPNGVKGYEEQVNSVGLHHGHTHWPSETFIWCSAQ